MRPCFRPLRALAIALCLAPAAARADGEFAQLDFGADDLTAVASFTRGAVSAGAVFSTYEGGEGIGFSITGGRDISLGSQPVTLRFGPTLSAGDGLELGLKAVAESYVATDWGGMFAIGEINSIDTAYFAMLEADHAASGTGLALVLTGDDTGYEEQSLVLSRSIGLDGALRLRMGYRLQARELFVGVAINTF